MNRARYLLVVVAVLGAPRVSWAGDHEKRERMARTACLAGDFTKGVALLSELFVDTEDPTYIYNQGRCFEQNRRYEDAIARFQEYLRAGRKLSRDEKEAAQAHIADCKELLASPSSSAPVLAAAPQPAVAPDPPTASAPVTPVVREASVPPATQSGAGLRTAGLATAAVGGAALVVGVVLNLKVNSLADDLQSTDGYSPGKESDRNSYEKLGWIGYGVGGACVATGTVLYLLGLRAGKASSDGFALVPALGTSQAGALVKGTF